MKIEVTTRAQIPTRLVADAAEDSERRAVGLTRAHLEDIRVGVTDRRLKPGLACCQVEIGLADGTIVVARSVNASPVEAVRNAFDKAARSVVRRLRQASPRRL